ncbi:MAG: pantoate--beta-alanine ligase [Clostridiales Family XIII bacterium]|jgi:pantoate--beta-alanine ligase|nr:pantoate--beta-alanine ligase [Clostridiales Family XIII bacterium]
MKIFKSIRIINSKIKKLKKEDKTIAFVPTMGSLHAGHLALIKQARRKTDIVVVSIFLNPTQFINEDDYKNYPINVNADIEILEKENIDILFMPKKETIYPENFSTNVFENSLTKKNISGKKKEEHFKGICTVVLKLFNIVKPDFAFFGEKDYQQFLIIKKMVYDLNLFIKIIPVKTIREKSGIALSSRNKRLTEKEKKLAENIYIALKIAREKKNIEEAKKFLIEKNIRKINYFNLLNADTLEEENFNSGEKSILLISVRIGKIDLIDNLWL